MEGHKSGNAGPKLSTSINTLVEMYKYSVLIRSVWSCSVYTNN